VKDLTHKEPPATIPIESSDEESLVNTDRGRNPGHRHSGRSRHYRRRSRSYPRRPLVEGYLQPIRRRDYSPLSKTELDVSHRLTGILRHGRLHRDAPHLDVPVERDGFVCYKWFEYKGIVPSLTGRSIYKIVTQSEGKSDGSNRYIVSGALRKGTFRIKLPGPALSQDRPRSPRGSRQRRADRSHGHYHQAEQNESLLKDLKRGLEVPLETPSLPSGSQCASVDLGSSSQASGSKEPPKKQLLQRAAPKPIRPRPSTAAALASTSVVTDTADVTAAASSLPTAEAPH
jgi:hypothetical protein